MPKDIKEHFVFSSLVGGTHCDRTGRNTEKQKAMAIVVNVEFSPETDEFTRTRPRIAAQRDYIEEAIRRFMRTKEYKDGLIAASFGVPIDGAIHDIGVIPSYAALEESYMNHKYGSIELKRGWVSQNTYDSLVDMFSKMYPYAVRQIPAPNYPTGLRFNAAIIMVDDDMQDGKIRWQYGESLWSATC